MSASTRFLFYGIPAGSLGYRVSVPCLGWKSASVQIIPNFKADLTALVVGITKSNGGIPVTAGASCTDASPMTAAIECESFAFLQAEITTAASAGSPGFFDVVIVLTDPI